MVYLNENGPTKVYPVVVTLLIREGQDHVTSEGAACDFMSTLLSDNEVIADWAYLRDPQGNSLGPEQVPAVELAPDYEEGEYFADNHPFKPLMLAARQMMTELRRVRDTKPELWYAMIDTGLCKAWDALRCFVPSPLSKADSQAARQPGFENVISLMMTLHGYIGELRAKANVTTDPAHDDLRYLRFKEYLDRYYAERREYEKNHW